MKQTTTQHVKSTYSISKYKKYPKSGVFHLLFDKKNSTTYSTIKRKTSYIKLNHIIKAHRFVGLWVCGFVGLYPSPGRIVAPIVVIFGTRVLCRPGKVIGYRTRLCRVTRRRYAAKPRHAAPQARSRARL